MGFDDKTEDFTPAGTATTCPLSAEFADNLPRTQTSGPQGSDSQPTVVELADSGPHAGSVEFAQVLPPARVGVDGGPRAVVPAQGADCPGQQVYERFINTANNLYYVPRSLNIADLRQKYGCIKTVDDAAKFAKQEIARIGDPFTQLKLPSDVVRSQPPFTGLDARFNYQAGRLGANGLVVSEVKPESAAARGGLQAGDRIVKANGIDLSGLEYDEATRALVGDKTKPATLEVMRGSERLTLNVPRPEKDFPLTDRMLDGKTAYIKINDFRDSSLSDQMFQALKRRDGAQAIILDLRGNPGGFLDEAVEIASFFMKDGTVLRTRQRAAGQDGYITVEHRLDEKNINKVTTAPGEERPKIETRLRTPYMVAGKQVIILTDERTASAGEILSGALQDSGSAMVIGNKTYGKGIGQTLVKDLPGGTELLVTSFRYETPKGRWPGQGVGPTESRGLAPDMKVDNIPGTVHGTSRDAQLAAALMFVRPLRPPVRRK